MKRHVTIAATILLLSSAVATTRAGDWPMYAHDPQRSHVTDDTLAFPLQVAWRYQCAQAPRPAWGPQPKVLNRTDYDHAPQLIVADGLVYFASSADDTIRALDAATGNEKWHYTTGGPVRFAPQIAAGRLYAASDDGYVYCLDAAIGKLVWRFCAAPEDRRVAGNGRVISRWPCRTGALVLDGVVYATAGLWPSEGVYIYALDAATGKVIWCNDTGGYLGQSFHDSDTGNHQGEFIVTGLAPEGALLADGDILLIPQGHSAPLRIDRNTGGRAPHKIVGSNGGFPGAGGTWGTIDNGHFYVMAMHRSRRTYLNRTDLTTGRTEPMRHSDRSIPQLTKEGLFRTVAPGRVSIVVHDRKILGRNAYDLVLAGNVLVEGQNGSVRAFDRESNEPVWQDAVEGEARSVVVANGSLLVATHTGQITCFAPGTLRSHPAVTPPPPAPSNDSLAPTWAAALTHIDTAGMTQGFALVFGDADGRFARALVQRTRLHVVNVMTDPSAVATLREKWLADTNTYGTRLHVQVVDHLDQLPFAQYLANVVVVAGDDADVSGKELYRVLRPCGGILLAPGLNAGQADALVRDSGAGEAETRRTDANNTFVIRGQLAGSLDFNTPRQPDRLVKWPLRVLWFGGPQPETLADYRSGEEFAKSPAVAFGRYFVQGETSMTAVDAYNGTVLWNRPLPGLWGNIRMIDGRLRMTANVGPALPPTQEHWRLLKMRRLGANDRHAYVQLGKGYFRRRSQAIVQLDARTGAQQHLYGPYHAPPQVSLAAPRSWALPTTVSGPPAAPSDALDALELDDQHTQPFDSPDAAFKQLTGDGGVLTLKETADGLAITLRTRDADVTSLDFWDLYFDFRPPARRFGLYDHGTFHLLVRPAVDDDSPTTWRVITGDAPADIAITGTLNATGTQATLRLPWTSITKLVGRRPTSFGFAATISSFNGEPNPETPVRQRHLYGDPSAAGVNNGWANVVLKGGPETIEPPRDVLLGPINDCPRGWMSHGAFAARTVDDSILSSARVHPLTGEPGPKIYRSGSWACGGSTFSAACIFRRPSKPAIGVYDFEDDSGLRFIPAVSSPCGSSSTAASGLLIFSESRFRCDCNAPLKTSLALAPAEKRLNEDWAIFYERNVDTLVRQATINLGAFGDRRDDKGDLWLSFPRTDDRGMGYALRPATRRAANLPGVWLKHVPASMSLPIQVDTFDGFGPYRRNADRTAVDGDDRPWIYASGYRGVKRIAMRVNMLEPVIATSLTAKPTIDGKLDELPAEAVPQALMPNTAAKVYVCHDADGLYVTMQRPAMIDRLGKVTPWATNTRGLDGPVWKDDSVEVFVSDGKRDHVLHVGVSASNARYDAVSASGQPEDAAWNGPWQSAVQANGEGLAIEIALPWSVVKDAGIQRHGLAINVQVNQSDVSAEAEKYLGGEGRAWNVRQRGEEALCYLGPRGRNACTNFVPLGLGVAPSVRPRLFAVRLHFAELDDVKPGTRVFDVKIQDRIVLENFDIVASGGARRAAVRDVEHVAAERDLVIEFVPKAKDLTPDTAPIIAGIELFDEQWRHDQSPDTSDEPAAP